MKLYLNSIKHDSQLTWNKTDYLLAAAKRLGFDWVLPYANQDDAEYVLNIEPFQNFVSGSEWTGIWEIDVLCDRREMTASNWTYADDVFVAVGTVPNRLLEFKDKVTLLLQACDADLHKRISTVEQQFDFVFSGTIGLQIYEERERVMEVLRKSGFTFHDFPKERPPHEYVQNINTAKVQFIRSMKTPVGDGELAQRFFECLAIGPVLTNWSPDLRHTGLIDGADFLSYQNDSDMIKKMRQLVFDDSFRTLIAENGRKKALLYHTYEHRLISIIERIKEHRR